MTSTTNLTADVTDYLVTQLQAETGTGGSLAGVTVFDGPQPSAAATGLEQVLWVGHNPMQETGQEFAEATQDIPFLGDHSSTQDERGWVQLAAKHWTGDPAMQIHRDGCKAIMAAVQLLLRGSPPSGPGDYSMGGLVFWGLVSGPYTWWQKLIDDGAEAFCAFRVTYYGRVTST